MEFKEILKALMGEKDLKQADLCRMTNIPTSLMSNYLSGFKSPALSNSKLIASALNVSLDTLSGKEPINLEGISYFLYNKLNRLDPDDMGKAEAYIDGLLASPKYEIAAGKKA